MTSNLTFSETGLCLVCNKVTTYGNAVNIYSGLTKRNGSIHDQISDIVGIKDITEACGVSEVICHICLKLLLGINHVESELKHLKLEFKSIFQSGVQSRKANTIKCVGYSDIKYDEPPSSEVESKDEEKISIDCDANERDFRTCILKAGEDCIYDANIVIGNIKESFHVEQSSISEKESISLEENTQENITHSKQCDFIQVTQENDGELQKEFSHALDFVNESVKKHEITCSTSDPDQKGNIHRTVDLPNIPGNLNDLPTSPNDAEDGLEGNLSFDFENFETRLCSTDTNEENTKKTANTGQKKSRRKSNSAGKPVKRKRALKDGKALPDAGEAPPKSFGKVEGWNMDEEGHEEYKHESRRKSSKLGRENFYDLCNQVLNNSAETVEHRVMNGDMYKYVCDQCPNVRYRHKAKLTQHFKLRHKYHVHQCPGCDTEETSQNSLDQHIINKHPESRFFECKYCHKAFRTYRYLHCVHVKRCHIGLPVKYFCDKCPKGFVDKSSLDNHKYTHSDVKNFSCKFCGAMFHTPYSLKVHVNIHTQEKKYTCPICGTSFLRLCNLIGHKKRAHHSREKRYVCEICGTQLHTNKDLVKHQDTCHNKGKPFSCDKCDKNFSNKKMFKTHLIEHLQDEPFKCHCGKAYMNRSCLQNHCKVAHRMEPGRNVTVSNGLVEEDIKGDDEKNEEENMVVITVKECSPPALYRVQTAPSHEIFISSEIPVSHVDSSALTKTLTAGQSVELPLLHSPFGSLGTDRVSLSAPILFTSLTTNPLVAVHHAQDAISQGILPSKLDSSMAHITSGVQEDFSYHSGSTATAADSEDQDPLQVLQEETRESQAANPLATELLELPGVHAGNPNDVPVTYITAWP